MSDLQRVENLYKLIANIQSVEECRLLFEDLCTYKEIENMADRIYAAQLLMQGNTYNQVIEQTNVSSATLSRISRCVKYGQGYKTMLNK